MPLSPARARALRAAPARDPAWLGRLAGTTLALVLLWPLMVATEFRPWLLLDADSLRVSGKFLASFFPPALGLDFLAMVLRETWRTVAMATAGISLALLLALPLTLLTTRSLSISALSGAMARGPFWLRQALKWLLIVLRSIPELVWALVFVRVVGLGPTAGVLAFDLPTAQVTPDRLARLYAQHEDELHGGPAPLADLRLPDVPLPVAMPCR